MSPTETFPKKILIINTFGIGDVLFTTPLIRNIKEKYPETTLCYLANQRTATILNNDSNIDKVFVYERDEFYNLYQESKIKYLKKVADTLKSIKEEGFDLVIDLSLNGTASFLMWVAGVKERIGFNYKNRSPFLTTKIDLKGYECKHVVEYYLDVLRKLDIPLEHKSLEIQIPQEDLDWADDVIKKTNLPTDSPIIVMIPGGGASWGKDAMFKRWPAEKFAKLADKVIENFPAAIILMGDKKETDLCSQVSEKMQQSCLNLCGQTTLSQMAAVLSKCRLAVVNDGGPMHVAVAAGAQTISIFGPVDDEVYGPYPRDNHIVMTKDIACRPCYRQFRRAHCEHVSCLNTIEVNDILERVKDVL